MTLSKHPVLFLPFLYIFIYLNIFCTELSSISVNNHNVPSINLKQNTVTVEKNGLLFTRNKIYFKQRKTASRNTSLTDPTNISNNQTQDLSAIKIAHTNINGIRNKVDHVSAELSDYDIICVSETKLNPTITNDKIEINGFKPPLRKDRALNNGGGLAIYSKTTYTH